MAVVVLGFYVPPTAKVIRRWDLGLKSHPKDLCGCAGRFVCLISCLTSMVNSWGYVGTVIILTTLFSGQA